MLDFEALVPAVKSAAQRVASRFPSHHDVEDVEQTLWVWIMENQNTLRDLVQKSEGSTRLIVDLLTRAGNSYLKKEDAQTYGYDEEDAFNFSTDLIKSILEVVFKHEDWQSLAQAIGDGMPRQKSDPATSGNNLASYADVSRAITALPEDQYNVLVWRYKYNYTYQQIGDQVGISKQGAENRHRAAVNAIQQYLGKRDLSDFRRGYGERTEARTNASMRARTERAYEG